ncbi:MAG: cytochrome c bioproteinis protein, transmembrane region [Parcubacteria group bacterium Gr01-1014_31]|nr:MAG: cytochrome c bioproteinis protein, transmembrane region [Parcubacteria group bacterium Gr01-1014_31]
MLPKKTWWLIAVLLGVGLVIISLRVFNPTQLLWQWSAGGQWIFPLVTVAALLDSVNPCAFSVLLLTIAFLLQIGKLRQHVLRLGFGYIIGLFSVYLLIGLGILQVLHLFNTPHFMARAGAVLLAVLGGINLINHWFPRFPIKLKIPAASHRAMGKLVDRASLPAAFGLGVLVGLCEFPCTGGPYLMILGLLHDQKTFVPGLGYLLWYNLLFIAPLVVILLLAADTAVLDRISHWQKNNQSRLRLYGGLLMVGLAALIWLL